MILPFDGGVAMCGSDSTDLNGTLTFLPFLFLFIKRDFPSCLLFKSLHPGDLH